MYHYADGDQQRGPVGRDELRGRIRPDTLVWREGMTDWRPAMEVEELRDLFTLNVVEKNPVAAEGVDLRPASTPDARAASPVIGYQSAGLIAPTPGLAVASMVMGIVGLVLICLWPISLICAVLAIVFGFVAKSQCDREVRHGKGMAIAGIILGFVPVALVVLFALIAVIAAVFGA